VTAGRLVLVLAAVLVAACSSNKPKPTPLEPFTAQLGARQTWNHKLSGVSFPLAVSVHGDQVTLAADDGSVVTLEAATGRELWRGNAGARIAAGAGSDGRFVSVVTADNELVTFDGGSVKWRQRLNSRVATAPLVAGERVFVMGVDRIVHAFDALDGRRIWTLQRPGELLTLAQAGVVAPFKNTLLVGQGPRLAGVDPLQGALRWEIPLASPRGANEVERLADLIGPLLRIGDSVCARAFQSAVGCADVERATLTWSKNVGGLQAVGGDAALVFGADASDRITAWRTASGDVAWTSEQLLYRGLSAPLALPKAALFGDSEGQLHFLSREGGQTLQRLPTDGSAVVAQPVLTGGTVIVVTRSGGVFGLRAD
jgi:outer membrane protein assembly factor BamB